MKSKRIIQQLKRSEFVKVLLIAILCALTGELKIIPFPGESFRFGLGGIVFFLLILIYRPNRLVRTGVVTGGVVVLFRIGLSFITTEYSLEESMRMYIPVFLFYFIFATAWQIRGVDEYRSRPFLLGAWAFLFEVVANLVEHGLRNWLVHQELLSFHIGATLIGVAFLRSFFTVGLYSSIALSNERRRVGQMLGVGSGLYAEGLYLQKSLNHIEQITASSHELYRKLLDKGHSELGIQALRIAQEIHEVKKDHQRILAGLTKFTRNDGTGVYRISMIIDLVLSSNRKYSEMLEKKCIFETVLSDDFETKQTIPLLAVLNNLVANAVEAIDTQGTVTLIVEQQGSWTRFLVKDNGKGISSEDSDVLFEPGFTTKYNDRGVAATGIGLSHVLAIVEQYDGKIHVERQDKGVVFQVDIPTQAIEALGEI